MQEALLQLDKVNKYYGSNHILKDVSIDIADGEFITLLGPSGCGKTTLLRCIAGLEAVNSGDILLKGKSITGLAPNKRSVNTVFQNYALFPHLDVFSNVAYGPRVRKSLPEDKLRGRVFEMLELVQMQGYEKRMPDQMSGGQMQRIAIARALINQPDILLLDEPLGALDLKLRKYMQTELASLQRQARTTFVYVTHDQEEALNMSDRIAVMQEGVIQQLGSPREVYNKPHNLFIADFIGDRNIKKVRILARTKDHYQVALGSSVLTVPPAPDQLGTGDTALLAVHKDKIAVSCTSVPNALAGVVVSIHYAGSQIKTQVDAEGEMITVVEYQKNECDYEPGKKVYLTWEESAAILLPPADYKEVPDVE